MAEFGYIIAFKSDFREDDTPFTSSYLPTAINLYSLLVFVC